MIAARFSCCLKKVVAAAGIDPSTYSIHSFRRGGATFAVDSGASVEAVKAQGNWRSNCYQKYMKRDKQLRSEFSAALVAGPEKFRTQVVVWGVWRNLAASRPPTFAATGVATTGQQLIKSIPRARRLHLNEVQLDTLIRVTSYLLNTLSFECRIGFTTSKMWTLLPLQDLVSTTQNFSV